MLTLGLLSGWARPSVEQKSRPSPYAIAAAADHEASVVGTTGLKPPVAPRWGLEELDDDAGLIVDVRITLARFGHSTGHAREALARESGALTTRRARAPPVALL